MVAPVSLPAAEIVVTGEGLPASRGDAAYDVIAIDRDRLRSTASGRIEDALKDVAGLTQYRRSDARSAHPTSQGVTLRGLGGNASSRALIVLDGVPQIDPFGGWATFTALDPARLDQVVVTRGGGSGIYGPGALAGTIELLSAGPDVLPPVSATVLRGSRDSIDGNASVASRLGAGFASLSAALSRGDGFMPIVADRRGLVDRPARYAQGSLAGRALMPIGAATELQTAITLLTDKRTRGLAGTDNRTTGADASLRWVGRGRLGFEALVYGQMRDFSSGFASANAARTVVMSTLDQYSVPSTGLGGRILLKPPLGGGIELRVGADARRTSGTTNELFSYVGGQPTRRRSAGGRTMTAGFFADASVPLSDTVIVTGGARVDRWTIDDGSLIERAIAGGPVPTSERYADRQGTRPTGRGGLVWSMGGGVRLRAAGYLGWRLPTLNELYRPFRAGTDATAANAALKPERSRGFDGGLDWRPLPSIRFAVTGFHNVLRDAIANVTQGTGPGQFPQVGFVAAGGTFRQRGNIDAVTSTGLEAEGEITDGFWRLSASYSLVDARVKASGTAAGLEGLRPAQTPRHQFSSTIVRESSGGLRVLGTVRYTGAQFENDQNSLTDKSALTVDLSSSARFGRGFSLLARVENVTDTLVVATITGDGLRERATPRTIWIGLRYGG